MPTIGITGTAARRRRPHSSCSSSVRRASACTRARRRAGNLWPTAELLEPAGRRSRAGVDEPHLCFMSHSPSVAAITCFWLDHLELHGSLERYAAEGDDRPRAGGGRRRRRERGRSFPAVDIATGSPGRRLGYSALGAVAEAHSRADRRSSSGPRRRGTRAAAPRPPRRAPAAGGARGDGRCGRGGRCRPASTGSARRSSARDRGRSPRRRRARRRRDGGDACQGRRHAPLTSGRNGRPRCGRGS